MKKLSRSILFGGLAGALVLSACGAGDNGGLGAEPEAEVLAFTEISTTSTTLLIDEEPQVVLSDEDNAMVDFEAAWVCELQRRTFDSPAAMNEALTQKLVDNGLDRAAYDEFRTRVNSDQGLRDWILFDYQSSCLS